MLPHASCRLTIYKTMRCRQSCNHNLARVSRDHSCSGDSRSPRSIPLQEQMQQLKGAAHAADSSHASLQEEMSRCVELAARREAMLQDRIVELTGESLHRMLGAFQRQARCRSG